MSTAPQTTELLRPGQRLKRDEFLRRWEAMPDLKFAELIDGVVYMPSPQTSDHGRLQFKVDTWLGTYTAQTPGCDGGTQSTWLMLRSAPQPDLYLWILPECGGQSRVKGQYHNGAPELAAEICYSSAAYDLGVKKSLYQKAGVREYVACLVEEQEILWHRLSKRAYVLVQPNSRGAIQSSIFPGLWLDTRALRKHDLARLLQSLQRGLDSAEHAAFVKTLAARQR
jgi:Uma2 family endonuclease